MAGAARTVLVVDTADSLINSDAHPFTINVTPGGADRVLILADPDQSFRPGWDSINGKSGSVNTKTAGGAFNIRLIVTDTLFNKVASSAPVVNLSSNDPFATIPSSTTVTAGEKIL